MVDQLVAADGGLVVRRACGEANLIAFVRRGVVSAVGLLRSILFSCFAARIFGLSGWMEDDAVAR